ncbi:ThiF family adenylyltransferase [Variovorax sp. PvP013]|uniref:ThiF family adenylyltransferase n=1 Tax=Variovorax sp. PvP013 TaxID=3156435 RepID=UPI003D1C1E71
MGGSQTSPEALVIFFEWLAEQSSVAVQGDWVWRDQFKEWSLPISVRIEGNPSPHVARETLWHLVLRSEGSSVEVKFYPDKQDGVTVTFAHQTYNGAGDVKRPWRDGHPCLDLPLARLGRVSWNDEPSAILPRLQWHLNRLVKWVEAAAAGELTQAGDPLELPDLRDRLAAGVVGFRELPEQLERMAGEEELWGYAWLTPVPDAVKTWVISERMNRAGTTLERVEWTSAIPRRRDSMPAPAVWLRLAELPVLEPWRRPETWQELDRIVAAQGIDLSAVLVRAGIRYRSERKRRKAYRLLLCFPMAEYVGEAPTRMHWLAIADVPLTEKLAKRNGFKPSEANHRRWDGEIAGSAEALRWQRTMNWAPDQLRTRGEARADVRGKRLLIIGAGSLGAAVADKLLRMGVTDMRILDGERLEVGNLSRHILGLSDAGHNKAIALARHLNLSMPDANVEGIAADFPPVDAQTRALVDACEVIVDCSAEDAVLDALASFPWTSEKKFISLSMAWRADGLLAFSASEASFPALDARSRFSTAPVPAVDFGEARSEGIGCWLPVFPARADDVHLWASIGCKFIQQTMSNSERRFAYFRQSESGEVERVET